MKKLLFILSSVMTAVPVCTKAQRGLVGFANCSDLVLQGTNL